MKEQKLIIMKTDKSGKLIVISREEYMKMGEVHTRKDDRQKGDHREGKTTEWSYFLLVQDLGE